MATAPPMYGDGVQAPYPTQPNICPQVPTPTQGKDVLVTKVEIHVSCSNLRDKDYLSKSDPMVVLFFEEKDNSSKWWKEFDRSEVVRDDLNPDFVKSFILEYHFEEHQKLKFEVYDSDSSSMKLDDHDFLGQAEVTLGSIVGEFGGKVTKELMNRKNERLNSSITFVAEELNDSREIIELQLKGRKLDRKDIFGSSDPFLIFYRHGIEGDEYTPVHKTEVIKKNLNPSWKKIAITATTLCNGDKHRPIKIECHDWNSDGTRDFIGECEITLNELLNNPNISRELVNPTKKSKKKSYKNSGWIDFVHIELRDQPSFLDYITGGIELCFHVAIDFTASNGNPVQPTSLHFMCMNEPNQYAQALRSVGQICEDYDSDKLIPAYGFGARINGNVYHNFPLNQSDNPNCYGIVGVLDAYHRFLPSAQLYGPTNFSPVINAVAQQAGAQTMIEKYHILLILTDGVITDMNQTKAAIINASKTPLAIIIVGVGNANFDAMNELDCDSGKLSFEGRVAEQDIVQFLPYRKFSGSFAGDDLAREVLYEVPTQLVTFMTSHNIKPRAGIQGGLVYNSGDSQYVSTAGGAPYPSHGVTPYPPQGGAPYPPQGGPANPPDPQMQNMNVNMQVKRQAPFAPGQELRTLSAKDAALLTLAKQ